MNNLPKPLLVHRTQSQKFSMCKYVKWQLTITITIATLHHNHNGACHNQIEIAICVLQHHMLFNIVVVKMDISALAIVLIIRDIETE